MKVNLEGKTAVVTGGAVGIGKEFCLLYAEHGANVAVLDINIDEAEKVAKEIQKFGCKSIALKVDVSNSGEVNAAFDKVVSEFGAVDIMVNNAGIYPESLVVDMPEEQWDKVIAISLKGAFNCSKVAAKVMINQQSGRIINMASRAGRQGSKRHAHYAAAKGGIIAFTMSLAKEIGPFGVTVNTIAPGIIVTGMTEEAIGKGSKPMSDYVVGRYGTTKDLRGVALLLASDLGSYITGATIDVNGGSWMG